MFYLLLYAYRVIKLPNGNKQNSGYNKRKCFAQVSLELESFFQTKEDLKNEIKNFERFFNTLPNNLNELQNSGHVIY